MRNPIWSATKVSALLVALCFSWSSLNGEPFALRVGKADTDPSSFDVASIRPSDSNAGGWRMEFTPDGFFARNVSLRLLIMEAFNAYEPGALAKVPAWMEQSHFDVTAKLDPTEVKNYQDLTLQQRRNMLADMLRARFALTVHREKKQRSVYVLEQTSSGMGMPLAKEPIQMGTVSGYSSLVTRSFPGVLEGKNFSLPELARLLQGQVERVVLDETHATGRYDFALHWTPDDRPSTGSETEGSAHVDGPNFFTAIREQLGLKLTSAQRPVDTLVIDNAQQPTAN